MMQNLVDLLSGKVHAGPTWATATAADAVEIIRDMCLRSGDGFPDELVVVDHDPKFTSEMYRASIKGMGSTSLRASSAPRTTRTPTPRSSVPNGVISDTLQAIANASKNNWERQLPLAVLAINNAASTLGHGLTALFIDWAHPRLPLSAPPSGPGGSGGDSPAHYAMRMHELELTVRELLAAAQQERKAKLDVGRADTVLKVGGPGAAADQGAA
jgi:hypothetical protein